MTVNQPRVVRVASGRVVDLELMRRMCAEPPEEDMVLDLEGVDYLNASALASFLRLRKHLLRGEQILQLTNVNVYSWGVLLTTGLNKLFPLVEDAAVDA